ncbi:MAG: carbohydrate ABC transporter permease [Candidatus Bruticola sp.]
MPFWWLFITSWKADGVYGTGLHLLWPTRWTSAYYERLFAANNQLPLLRFFINTVLYCILGVLLEVSIAALAAYPLARLTFKGKEAVMLVLAAVLALPSQANTIINFTTIRALGLYDTVLGVILPGAVSVFTVLLCRQAFLNIPRELEDAARLDGCGEWAIFYHVCLPLNMPVLSTAALFAFTANWNSFLWPLVILKSEKFYPISVGLAYLSSSFDSDFRVVAAGSFLAALPMIIFFLAIQKHFIKGITSGAIKS